MRRTDAPPKICTQVHIFVALREFISRKALAHELHRMCFSEPTLERYVSTLFVSLPLLRSEARKNRRYIPR